MAVERTQLSLATKSEYYRIIENLLKHEKIKVNKGNDGKYTTIMGSLDRVYQGGNTTIRKKQYHMRFGQ